MSAYTDALMRLHQAATTVKYNAVETEHGWLIYVEDFAPLAKAVDDVTREERKEKPRQFVLLEAS